MQGGLSKHIQINYSQMRTFILTVVMCCFFATGWSQTKVSGKITDDTGLPLESASVGEKGTNNGGLTDSEGNFEINLSGENPVLVVTYVGFEKQEIEVAGQSELIIAMVPGFEIDDVVMTAFALKRESKDLGYALQTIDSRQVSGVKSPNFVDNLAGRFAGVTVSQGATGVGSTSKISIRGEASFTNNNPLFVVDGTPINNNSVNNFTNDAAAGFQEVDFGNGGMELNADDIESVTVLKGPGAAALYGTRASNGVIIITTKSGAGREEGVGVSFSSTTYMDQPFQLPRFQNRYGQGNSGQFEFVDGLGGGTNDNITYSWGPELDQGTLISQYDSPVTLADGSVVRGGDVAVHGGLPITPTPFVSHADNLKDFYRTGFTTQNNLSISSGNEKGDFRLSLTDLRSESPIPGVNLNRKSGLARFNFRPTDKLTISSTINYLNSQSDNRPANGYGSENINYSLVAWGPRSMDTEILRDYWQPGLEGVQQYSFNYTFFDNPFFILKENRNSLNRDRLLGNVMARYELAEGLSVTLRTGMDYSNELRKFRRNYSTNRFRNGAYAEHTVFFRENNTDILLNYGKTFGDFSLDVSAGANRMDQRAATVQTQALSLAQPGVFQLSNAASPLEIQSFESHKRINSAYAFAKLGYRNFLFLDLTARNDWSSALATPQSTEGTGFFYPSASSSFVLSNALELPEVISFAKVRASWAQVGNDTDPYLTAGTFLAQTPFNSSPTFSDQGVIANSGLLPERTSSIEFGTDIRFFDDRVRLDVAYYDATTRNQIISLPIPISSGYTEQVVNGGVVRSRGLEAVLGVSPIRKKGFRWDATFNFSRNVSTVEELPDGAGTLALAYSRVYDNVNQTVWYLVQEDSRIGEMYGTGYAKNENGDFIIDANGSYVVDNDLILLGNYNPDFVLGISNRLQFKNWDFNFLFDWRQGGILVSRTQALAGVAGQLEETVNRPDGGIIAEGVVNVGTVENPVWEANTTAIPAETYYRQYYDRNHEENNTYDASYFKLRQVSLGYTFKGSFFKEGRNLRIAFVGRNIFAISKIPHFDPEQSAVQGQQFVSGVEDMSYPTSRSLGIKIGLDF